MGSQAYTAGIAKLIGYESVGAPPYGKSFLEVKRWNLHCNFEPKINHAETSVFLELFFFLLKLFDLNF